MIFQQKHLEGQRNLDELSDRYPRGFLLSLQMVSICILLEVTWDAISMFTLSTPFDITR